MKLPYNQKLMTPAIFKYICIVTGLILTLCPEVLALKPDQVLLIANKNDKASIPLARFYMEKRNIPEQNLVIVSTTQNETCSRKEYESKIIPPVRKFVKNHPSIRVLLIMYGMPLRVASPNWLPSEKEILEELERQKKDLENLLIGNDVPDPKIRQDKHTQLSDIKTKITSFLRKNDKVASLDSELSLVKVKNYELNMWLPNPYYLGFRNSKTQLKLKDILMTSRLDGPDEDTVRRIILDAVEAEKTGLKGNACFDARWKDPGEKKLSGYAFYDKSIHTASRILEKEKRIPVILDDTPTLFSKGKNLKTALYCGWYSHKKYIDAFSWQKGSVGYHIASSECTTLKKKDSQVWCKKMLEKGIAATVGPVGEPYVQAFPVPEIFFTFLTEGYLSLAETYIISLPFLSWKMILIGDPLYMVNIQS